MKIALAFDVYGTLIDTAGVVTGLKPLVGPDAEAFSQMWRDKQLEYAFRRGLMRRYETFAVCTRDALDYTCRHFRANLSRKDRESLLALYPTLPAFDDVADGLGRLGEHRFDKYAFSNGTASAVATLLDTARIRNHFIGIVSVDDLQTFKPNPDVYRHFLETAKAEPENAWLISGNPFDVIGAMSIGMKGAWVRRSDSMIFDPWGIEPTITVTSLTDIGERILAHRGG